MTGVEEVEGVEDVDATTVVVVVVAGTANGVVTSRREKPKAAMPSRTPQMTTTMARNTEDKRIAGHCGSPITYDLRPRTASSTPF